MTVANLHHLDEIDTTANWLGHVLWFTISEAHVSRLDLIAIFDRHGLDHRYLPADITPLDAYKRVTGKVKGEYVAASGNVVRILVRDVATEPELVTRHLVREEVDAKGRSLAYEEIGAAVFHRPDARAGTRDGWMQVECYDWRLPGVGTTPDGTVVDEKAEVDQIIQGIRLANNRALNMYDSQAVRNVVRGFIVAQRAIAVRPSGGVYFVHNAHTEELAKIQRVVKDLPGGSTLHALPLVDDVEQRAMLADAYTAEVTDEVDKLLRDIAEAGTSYVMAGRGVPKRTRDALMARLSEASAKAMEHSERLDLVNDQSRAGLSAAADALMALLASEDAA